MIPRIVRGLCLTLISLGLGACRIELIVPEGGEVHFQDAYSLSGPYMVCDAGQACTATISTPDIIGTYFAVPHAGWKFAGWQRSQWYICGPGRGSADAQDTSCIVDISGFRGHPELEDIVADDSRFVTISPIFVPDDSAVPITDTVIVAGKEWAQPADFVGFSWEGINGICPGGSCGPGAILNGFDMEGWTLATVDDLNALANHYLAGEYFMGPGADEYGDAYSAMSNMVSLVLASYVFADGPFRSTPFYGYHVGGAALVDGHAVTTSTGDSGRTHLGTFRLAIDRFLNLYGSMSTTGTVPKDWNDLETGAFFYRLP